MIEFYGQVGSPGLARGASKFITPKVSSLLLGDDTPISSSPIEVMSEIKSFRRAIEACKQFNTKLIHELKNKSLEHEALVFETHTMILEDPELLIPIEEMIQSHIPAEQAVRKHFSSMIQVMEELNDPYLKQRALDLKDIGIKLLENLNQNPKAQSQSPGGDFIYFAEDLLPSDIVSIKGIQAVVLRKGGVTSHTAVLARALGIPLLCGVHFDENRIGSGDVIVDAQKGRVVIDPDANKIEHFQESLRELQAERKHLQKWINQKSYGPNGRHIEVLANILTHEEAGHVFKSGAEGIGLFRTEFLFLDRAIEPTFEEQLNAYNHVMKEMVGKTLIIRTFDIGGDKVVPYLQIEKEDNPFLGLRGIRLALKREQVLRNQFKALFHAKLKNPQILFKIMIPMVTEVREVVLAKQIYIECGNQVFGSKEFESIQKNKQIQFGIMIETPAAALSVASFKSEIDFVSIGTNDLLQYTCAVDRMNNQVHELYSPLNPGFLKLMKLVLNDCKSCQIPVGICGSLAHHPELIKNWIDWGVDELSMSAQHILKTREIIASKYQLHS